MKIYSCNGGGGDVINAVKQDIKNSGKQNDNKDKK